MAEIPKEHDSKGNDLERFKKKKKKKNLQVEILEWKCSQ